MRVLLSCLQSPVRHALPAYDFWRFYFLEGLKEAGVECVEVPGVDWAEGLACGMGEALEAWKGRTWQATVAAARGSALQAPVDLFLSYLYPEQVEAQAIQEIQSFGIPCVNFFCDNVREFRHVPAEFSPFALHWVPEFEALPMYEASAFPFIHAPMPCWIPPGVRVLCERESEPPTFLGSADDLRRDLLADAIDLGADIMVRGVGWATGHATQGVDRGISRIARMLANQVDLVQRHGLLALVRKLEGALMPFTPNTVPATRVGLAVSSDEYVRITREAVVTIGINRVPTARSSNRKPLRYSRLRDIEAPMMGACYLTEWTEGLGSLYELGEEIESYKTADEMCSKLIELGADRNRRLRLRSRGQARALSTHSVARSLKSICNRLGLHVKG